MRSRHLTTTLVKSTQTGPTKLQLHKDFFGLFSTTPWNFTPQNPFFSHMVLHIRGESDKLRQLQLSLVDHGISATKTMKHKGLVVEEQETNFKRNLYEWAKKELKTTKPELTITTTTRPKEIKFFSQDTPYLTIKIQGSISDLNQLIPSYRNAGLMVEKHIDAVGETYLEIKQNFRNFTKQINDAIEQMSNYPSDTNYFDYLSIKQRT